ncbi:hypothetical protein HK102_013393 [Quaeritorhiza haematococci]|nr:hypothetical protein HK102_013393 [Quaeritorhiza haematococci]
MVQQEHGGSSKPHSTSSACSHKENSTITAKKASSQSALNLNTKASELVKTAAAIHDTLRKFERGTVNSELKKRKNNGTDPALCEDGLRGSSKQPSQEESQNLNGNKPYVSSALDNALEGKKRSSRPARGGRSSVFPNGGAARSRNQRKAYSNPKDHEQPLPRGSLDKPPESAADRSLPASKGEGRADTGEDMVAIDLLLTKTAKRDGSDVDRQPLLQDLANGNGRDTTAPATHGMKPKADEGSHDMSSAGVNTSSIFIIDSVSIPTASTSASEPHSSDINQSFTPSYQKQREAEKRPSQSSNSPAAAALPGAMPTFPSAASNKNDNHSTLVHLQKVVAHLERDNVTLQQQLEETTIALKAATNQDQQDHTVGLGSGIHGSSFLSSSSEQQSAPAPPAATIISDQQHLLNNKSTIGWIGTGSRDEIAFLRHRLHAAESELSLLRETVSRPVDRPEASCNNSSSQSTTPTATSTTNTDDEKPSTALLNEYRIRLSRQSMEIKSLLQQNEILRTENRRMMENEAFLKERLVELEKELVVEPSSSSFAVGSAPSCQQPFVSTKRDLDSDKYGEERFAPLPQVVGLSKKDEEARVLLVDAIGKEMKMLDKKRINFVLELATISSSVDDTEKKNSDGKDIVAEGKSGMSWPSLKEMGTATEDAVFSCIRGDDGGKSTVVTTIGVQSDDLFECLHSCFSALRQILTMLPFVSETNNAVVQLVETPDGGKDSIKFKIAHGQANEPSAKTSSHFQGGDSDTLNFISTFSDLFSTLRSTSNLATTSLMDSIRIDARISRIRSESVHVRREAEATIKHLQSELLNTQNQFSERVRIMEEERRALADRVRNVEFERGEDAKSVSKKFQEHISKVKAEMRQEKEEEVGKVKAELRHEVKRREEEVARVKAEMKQVVKMREGELAKVKAEMNQMVKAKEEDVAKVKAELEVERKRVGELGRVIEELRYQNEETGNCSLSNSSSSVETSSVTSEMAHQHQHHRHHHESNDQLMQRVTELTVSNQSLKDHTQYLEQVIAKWKAENETLRKGLGVGTGAFAATNAVGENVGGKVAKSVADYKRDAKETAIGKTPNEDHERVRLKLEETVKDWKLKHAKAVELVKALKGELEHMRIQIDAKNKGQIMKTLANATPPNEGVKKSQTPAAVHTHMTGGGAHSVAFADSESKLILSITQGLAQRLKAIKRTLACGEGEGHNTETVKMANTTSEYHKEPEKKLASEAQSVTDAHYLDGDSNRKLLGRNAPLSPEELRIQLLMEHKNFAVEIEKLNALVEAQNTRLSSQAAHSARLGEHIRYIHTTVRKAWIRRHRRILRQQAHNANRAIKLLKVALKDRIERVQSMATERRALLKVFDAYEKQWAQVQEVWNHLEEKAGKIGVEESGEFGRKSQKEWYGNSWQNGRQGSQAVDKDYDVSRNNLCQCDLCQLRELEQRLYPKTRPGRIGIISRNNGGRATHLRFYNRHGMRFSAQKGRWKGKHHRNTRSNRSSGSKEGSGAMRETWRNWDEYDQIIRSVLDLVEQPHNPVAANEKVSSSSTTTEPQQNKTQSDSMGGVDEASDMGTESICESEAQSSLEFNMFDESSMNDASILREILGSIIVVNSAHQQHSNISDQRKEGEGFCCLNNVAICSSMTNSPLASHRDFATPILALHTHFLSASHALEHLQTTYAGLLETTTNHRRDTEALQHALQNAIASSRETTQQNTTLQRRLEEINCELQSRESVWKTKAEKMEAELEAKLLDMERECGERVRRTEMRWEQQLMECEEKVKDAREDCEQEKSARGLAESKLRRIVDGCRVLLGVNIRKQMDLDLKEML